MAIESERSLESELNSERLVLLMLLEAHDTFDTRERPRRRLSPLEITPPPLAFRDLSRRQRQLLTTSPAVTLSRSAT